MKGQGGEDGGEGTREGETSGRSGFVIINARCKFRKVLKISERKK